MSRKLSLAFLSTLIASGAAVAAPSSGPYPMSPNESGPYEPAAYYAPSRAAAPVLATARTGSFPMSVSESGLNYPDVYAPPVVADAQPTHAELLARSRYGSTGMDRAARNTVRVGPAVRYVNVQHFDQVRLVDQAGKAFTWKFDTLDETHFPLAAIAPSGFDAAGAVVYVRHPNAHVATD